MGPGCTLPTNDVQRLEPLLALQEKVEGGFYSRHLAALVGKLSDCREAEPAAIGADVVTMNSRVVLEDVQRGRAFECTLVFPRDGDYAAGYVSVLTPLGAALLGSRVGAAIELGGGNQPKRYLIRRMIFQPEAVGRYDL